MHWLFDILKWLNLGVGFLLAIGTALSLSRHPHWFVRGWDFPRVQIAVLAGLTLVIEGVFLLFVPFAWYDGLFIVAMVSSIGWQVRSILPYTWLWRKEVCRSDLPPEAPEDSEEAIPETTHHHGAMVRLLVSNVLMENESYDHWLKVARAADPDVILAVEVNQKWVNHIKAGLGDDFPHQVAVPQENCYGMMLLSRLELVETSVRHIVEADIPSIHAKIKLRDGREILLRGLHPRPPEPVRDEDATARNAELVVVGREVDDQDIPVIVAGDLNDVAWSHNTQLFRRLSSLVDPRRGRGFYNTWHTNSKLFRCPLDHVFHSPHFKLIDLRRLEDIGSDHFPVLITLEYHTQASQMNEEPEQTLGDEEEATEKIEGHEEQNGTIINSPQRD